MSDKTKHVIFEINEDLKHRFKQVCLSNKESQKDAMNRLVKYYINENGELVKKG